MLGAIIAGTSPPKPTETPNNLQLEMSVAWGGLNIDSNNDDSDDDAMGESINEKKRPRWQIVKLQD